MSTASASKRPLFKIFLLSALLALSPALAEAKMGSLWRGGAGSRGSRTFTPPPATRTAPTTAAPIERSTTAPPSTAQQTPGFGARAPGPGMATQGGFGRGFMGGLAGGLLGAGLLGMLTGHGFWGGMGGFASFVGFLLQIALLFALGSLAYAWWRGRQGAPATAGGAPRVSPFAFSGGGAFGGAGPRQRPRTEPLQLSAADFPVFERALTQIQDAYSREDSATLSRLATPEMAGYLNEELAEKRRRGLVNRISEVKLLQGDLSEAWREGGDDYATVAMRFSMVDVTQERATGKVVSGDSAQPTQSTEVWTFRRRAGSGPDAWTLSAIQQAA